MSQKTLNKLPDNLPQLQNLIKRQPDLYKDEVRLLLHFRSYVKSRVNELCPVTTISAASNYI